MFNAAEKNPLKSITRERLLLHFQEVFNQQIDGGSGNPISIIEEEGNEA